MSLNVSSPPNVAKPYAPFLAAGCIGVVFSLVELLLRRPVRTRFASIALDSGLTSLIGSVCLIIIFVVALVVFGFADTQFIFLELFSALILVATLTISVFLCILPLRTIDFLIRRARNAGAADVES